MPNDGEKLSDATDMSLSALKELAADFTPQALSEMWSNFDPEQARKIFLALDIEKKADLISILPDIEQEKIIAFLSEQNTRLLVEEMEPDDLVDLIQSMSHEVRHSVWESLND